MSVASDSLLVVLALTALARGLHGRIRAALLSAVPLGAAVVVAAGLLTGAALT